MSAHRDDDPQQLLSGTERQIADYLVAGMNSSEISKRMSLSYHLVAETSKRIRQKLGVASVTELKTLLSQDLIGKSTT